MAVRGRAACEGPRGTSVAIGAPARLGEVRGVRVTGTYGACPVCERRLQWRCSVSGPSSQPRAAAVGK